MEAILEQLHSFPELAKVAFKDNAQTGSQMALVMAKSHYPSIEMEDIREGLAADFPKEEVPILMEEVKTTAFSITDVSVKD